MYRGYVKLWRKIDDNAIALRPAYLSVWLFILRKANHANKNIIWNNQKTMIKKGSFITSADKIAQGTGVPRGTVERILKYLENEVMIKEQTTRKFRLISVVNYDDYQGSEEVNEEQVRNKRGTSEEQVDTTKNNKELNNINKELKNDDKSSYAVALDHVDSFSSFGQEDISYEACDDEGNSLVKKTIKKGVIKKGGRLAEIEAVMSTFKYLTGVNPVPIKAANGFDLNRGAALRLVKKFGKKRVNERLIRIFDEMKKDQYCRRVTNPIELERNWVWYDMRFNRKNEAGGNLSFAGREVGS